MLQMRTPISVSNVRLGIACPMANEGALGSRFVEEVLARCDGFREVRFFAILDKATTDNTRELLDQLAGHEPRLHVVWAPENRCVVDAYLRGYREALAWGADWILEIDAGFSHQPDDIPQFFAMMMQGYDCVFGSRMRPGGRIVKSSLKRRCVSWGGTVLTNLLLGTTLTDMTSGFELFSRGALQMVLEKGIQSRAHFFQTEIKVHCRHLKIAEVPITYTAASPRLSNASLWEAFQQLGRLSRQRWTRIW
jgi:dolichol-phosphate mannosyltransferase